MQNKEKVINGVN